MITAKFGGTAMTAQNFGCLKKLVTANCGCVVVSAIGKTYAHDKKTTDLLWEYYNGNADAWGQLEQKHRHLVRKNGVPIDVDKLLYEARQKSLLNGVDYCLSLGEELIAKIAAAYLNLPYFEADRLVSFSNGKLQLKVTLANLKSAFNGVKCGVIGGFYGGSTSGRCVFSRGGGDVTGSLCAAATGSNLYENWTDVCGVFKANPTGIDGAVALPELSYRQMYLLARGGAQVLHPDAVKIAEAFGVPIKVGNYLNPEGQSTLVSNFPSSERFLAVTERKCRQGVVSLVLHRLPADVVCKCLQHIYNLTDAAILQCEIDVNRVEICSSHSILQVVFDTFSTAQANCC